MPINMKNRFVRAGVILAATTTWTGAVSTIVGFAAVDRFPQDVINYYQYATGVALLFVSLLSAYVIYTRQDGLRENLIRGATTAFAIRFLSFYLAIITSSEYVRSSRDQCDKVTVVVLPPPPLEKRLRDIFDLHSTWDEALCDGKDRVTIEQLTNEGNGFRKANLVLLLITLSTSFAISIILLVWGILVDRDDEGTPDAGGQSGNKDQPPTK